MIKSKTLALLAGVLMLSSCSKEKKLSKAFIGDYKAVYFMIDQRNQLDSDMMIAVIECDGYYQVTAEYKTYYTWSCSFQKKEDFQLNHQFHKEGDFTRYDCQGEPDGEVVVEGIPDAVASVSNTWSYAHPENTLTFPLYQSSPAYTWKILNQEDDLLYLSTVDENEREVYLTLKRQ